MENLINALYSKLLLRDVFAKITPGAILLLSVWHSFSDFNTIFEFLSKHSNWLWLIYLGVSWLTAFAIQSLGEKIGLIRLYTNDINKKDYLDMRYKSDGCPVLERQQRERFAIIKEACGNGYVAIILSIVVIALDTIITCGFGSVCNVLKNNWHVVILGFILISFLARMHFEMVEKHQEYIKWIVEKLSKGSIQPSDESSS